VTSAFVRLLLLQLPKSEFLKNINLNPEKILHIVCFSIVQIVAEGCDFDCFRTPAQDRVDSMICYLLKGWCA